MATSLPYIMYNEYKWFTENGMWHKDTGNENQLHIYNDPTRTNHKVEQLPQLSQQCASCTSTPGEYHLHNCLMPQEKPLELAL